jgi:NhaP-type Na+/H+ or K+/H+ antiporter
MPLPLSFALAYILACVSPSVMVPSLITLYQHGYGHTRGVINSLITAGTFDDIICIIIFGICKTVVYKHYGLLAGTVSANIGKLFLENFAGLMVGILLGLLGVIIKADKQMYLKSLYCIVCAVSFVLIGEAI